MAKTKSWEVTDDFWKRVVLLVPPRQPLVDKVYVRKAGGGRKPKDARLVFEGIVYVLRTVWLQVCEHITKLVTGFNWLEPPEYRLRLVVISI